MVSGLCAFFEKKKKNSLFKVKLSFFSSFARTFSLPNKSYFIIFFFSTVLLILENRRSTGDSNPESLDYRLDARQTEPFAFK